MIPDRRGAQAGVLYPVVENKLLNNLSENITPDSVLTPEMVATRFRKSVKWVYNHAKELGGSKIGGSWFFTERGLSSAIQRGQEVEGQGNGSGQKIHEVKKDSNRSLRVGSPKEKRTPATRQALAVKAGLAEFL
jgi:hypothetical protein